MAEVMQQIADASAASAGDLIINSASAARWLDSDFVADATLNLDDLTTRESALGVVVMVGSGKAERMICTVSWDASGAEFFNSARLKGTTDH